jgi:hypothetical protein
MWWSWHNTTKFSGVVGPPSAAEIMWCTSRSRVDPQTAQPAPGLESSTFRTLAAPGRCHARLLGDLTACRLHLEPFGILVRQTVQNDWGT